MSQTSLYPRGNALTESMPFSDADGTTWLAYIEGVPQSHGHVPGHLGLPGRRLRFDSAGESRVTTELPAGSPFLPEARLQALLDEAKAIAPPSTSTWKPPESRFQPRRLLEQATRAGKLGAAELETLARRWREGADRRRALSRRFQDLVSAAFDRAVSIVDRIRTRRPNAGQGGAPADDAVARRASLARRWRGARSGRRVGPRG